MADGPTRVHGLPRLRGHRATLRAVSAVGAGVREGDAGRPRRILRRDRGGGRCGGRSAQIDVGNAGTLLRIMPGAGGQPEGAWSFDGDESTGAGRSDRIAEPLRLMGADVGLPRRPPAAAARARSRLRGIDYEMPVASAQVKSCLLLAGLLAEGETEITSGF